jgi:transcription elongation factor Elf1
MEWHNFVFPVLLLCGFFGIILLVGIGSTYLWLVWLDKEATKCPKCGKKGAGELVETKVLQSRVYTEWKDTPRIFSRDPRRRQPIQVTEKTYEDHFKCKYCGHQWTTTSQERKRSTR